MVRSVTLADCVRVTAHSEEILPLSEQQGATGPDNTLTGQVKSPTTPWKSASGKLATIFKLPHYRRRRKFRRKSNRRCLNSMMSSFAAAAADTMTQKGGASSAFSITLQCSLRDPDPEALGSARLMNRVSHVKLIFLRARQRAA